jgi:anti-sigma factor RsiW
MSSCRDLESLFASYVDGEAAAADRASIDGHLERCPACRHRIDGERTARHAVVSRRECLRAPAPVALRARCAAQAVPAAPAPVRRPLFGLHPWFPLSAAASLVVGLAAVLIFVLNDPVQSLAAHLADDHDQCFLTPPAPGDAGGDPAAAAASWLESGGEPLHIAASSPGQGLELLGLRRCKVTEGRTAHLMYRWGGVPLSVFILPQAFARRSDVEQIVEKFGHEAIVWCDRQRGRTYVVVVRGRPRDVAPVVSYLKVNTE